MPSWEKRCPAGLQPREGSSAQLLPTERIPRSPPAELGLTAAGLLRRGRRRPCCGQRPSVSVIPGATDPAPGSTRSRRALPARGSRARFRGGARAGRGGPDRPRRGSFVSSRPGVPPRRPKAAFCRVYSLGSSAAVSWSRRGRSPQGKSQRCVPLTAEGSCPPRRAAQCAPSSRVPWAAWRRALSPPRLSRLTARAAPVRAVQPLPGAGTLPGVWIRRPGPGAEGESRKLGTGCSGGQTPKGSCTLL